MAITLFGATSNPADNGTADGNPTLSITPVASMVAGQLCVVFSVDRAGTSSHSVSNAAGQTWTKLSNGWGETYWCVFNGTWTTDPVFDYTGTVNLSLIMLVFAPTGPGYIFGYEAATYADIAAPASPFTITITGRTTTHASTVSIAGWFTSDDNTFGSLSGSGWVKTSLSAQYRNLAGQDSSSSYAYNIQTSIATLANVSQNMSASDGAATRLITFWEFPPGEFIPRNIEQPYRSKRLVIGAGLRNLGITPFDTDAQTFIDTTGLSSDLHKNSINQLVGALKGAGLWTKCNAIYPFIGGTAAKHKWNLKNPVDSDAAFRLVFYGGWTHSSTGALPNGVDTSADTFLTPSAVLSLNSAHVSFYSRTNIAQNNIDIGEELSMVRLVIRTTVNELVYNINDNDVSYGTVANTTSLGFFILSRTASNARAVYRNGAVLQSSSDASGTLSTNSLKISSVNNGAQVFSDREVAFVTIGSSLTATEAAGLNSIVESFQDSLSRGVQ